MPLPHIKNFCSAKSKRSGQPCKNPAAFGCKTCRFHGAHRIRRNKEAPNYKTGIFSESGIAAYRSDMARLNELEDVGFKIGLIAGKRTPGRKQKY